MNKQELIKQIADKVKLSQKEVELILNNLFQKIENNTANGQVTTFKNFGTFFAKKRKARTIKVFGKELMQIAEKQTVGFRFSRNFKKIIAAIVIKNDAEIKEKNKEKAIFENIATKNYKAKEGGKITELITGNRKNSTREERTFELSYRGKIGYEVVKDFVQWTDKPNYPIISLPTQDALVLEAYTPKNNSTKGVCENLFYEELTKYFTDIRRDLILPIKDRKYGYQPDLVYVDESCNLFIDIEIDEPYDGVTRKPTHYHNSYDTARDYYFNEQGWVVVRFTEEQVYKEKQACCKKIAELVDKLTKSSLLTKFEDVFDLTPAKSWTFEEAQAMASAKYREQYLGILFSETQEEEEIEIESYGNANQTTEISKIASLKILDIAFSPSLLQKKQEIEQLVGKHIRFDYGKNDVTDLIKIIRVEQNRNQLFMLGYSLIDNAENRYELRLIENFEVIENPILMQGTTPQEIEACLDFAIENFRAVFIHYEKISGEKSKRTLSNIFFYNTDYKKLEYHWLEYVKYIRNWELKNSQSWDKEYLCVYCHSSIKDANGRTFITNFIKAIQVLNTNYTDYETMAFINSLGWKNLFLNQFYKAKENFLRALSIIPENLTVLGNLAHTYLLLGEYNKAIDIYNTHKGKKLSEKTSWEDMVKSDFAEFQKAGITCNDFEKVLALLKN